MSDAEEIAFREMFPLVIGALAGMALLFLVVALIIDDGDGVYVPPGKTKMEAISDRVRPLGEINMGGPVVAEDTTETASAEEQAGPRSGETVYSAACAACHANGTLGAPVLGDTDAWSDRAEKGLETLVEHSLNGFNQMPAQKGAGSPEEIENAVLYMLEEAGVEP
jgi:cytochrome c5